MKQLVFLFLAFFSFCDICIADIIDIKLYNVGNDDLHIGNPMDRSLSIIPSVTYDNEEDCLKIISYASIDNVCVKIINGDGSIVLEKNVSLSNISVNIQIADISVDDIFIIEIEYGDTCLFGYINTI